MENSLKIAIAQMDCLAGEVNKNLARMEEFAGRAAERGCRLILFPEMADVGYDLTRFSECALDWQGKEFEKIAGMAARYGIYLLGGISQKTAAGIYNTLTLFDPAGEVRASYRKIHLADYPPLNEGQYVLPGHNLVLTEIDGFKAGLTICYDLRFPEMYRRLALEGAEIIFHASAWPFPRQKHLETLISARAIENQLYLVSANRCGRDGKAFFCGSSRIVDPYGIVVTSASEIEEDLLVGEIRREKILKTRKRMPVFKHRHPDVDRV
ncbi:MAG: carbon-nitrogen family hydrolase [Calditrichia bacterium]